MRIRRGLGGLLLALALHAAGCVTDEDDEEAQAQKLLDQAQEGSQFRSMSDECMQIDCSDYNSGSLEAGNELDEKRAFDFIHAIHCVRFAHRMEKKTVLNDGTASDDVRQKAAAKTGKGGKQAKSWTETNMAKLSDDEKITMNCLIRKLASAGPDQLLTVLAQQCAKEAGIGRNELANQKLNDLFQQCVQSNDADGGAAPGDDNAWQEQIQNGGRIKDAGQGPHGEPVDASQLAPETNKHDMSPTKMMTAWFEQAFLSKSLAKAMIQSLESAEEQRALIEDLRIVFGEFRMALKFLVRDTLRLAAEQVVADETGRVRAKKQGTATIDAANIEVSADVLDFDQLLELPDAPTDLGSLLDGLSVDHAGEVHGVQHRHPRRVAPAAPALEESVEPYWAGT